MKEKKAAHVFEELENQQKQQPEKPKTKLEPPKEEVPASSQNQLSCLYCSFVPKNGPKTSMDHKKPGYPRRQVRMHMHRTHFLCKICEVRFGSSKKLNIHMDVDHVISNSQEGPRKSMVTCSIGGCSFKALHNGQTIHDHVNLVHKGIVYRCDDLVMKKSASHLIMCGRSFSGKGPLERHKKKLHTINLKAKKLKVKKVRTKFKCSFCDIMLYKVSFKSHIQRIHSNLPLQNCSTCSFSTKYPESLKVHEQAHIERLTCTICPYSTPRPTQLKQHIKFKHEGGEIYLCTFCDFKTGIHGLLIVHENRHGERKFKCDVCIFTGKTEGDVKRHKKRHDDPKYLCEKCDYKTYDMSNFKVHTIERHGNISLVCKNCDFSTNSKRTLSKHNKKKHIFL